MNARIQDFLKDLFEGKNYSWILDTTTNTLYFRPKEILVDAGYTDRAIQDKLLDLDTRGKRKFTNEDLEADTVLNRIQKPSNCNGYRVNNNGALNNAGEYWVTVYALIDMLQGRKRKATEIKNWLIYEVLPAIDKNGGYIDDSATQEQLEQLKRDIDEILVKTYTRADAAQVCGYNNGTQFEDDLIKYGYIKFEDKNIVSCNEQYFTHTAKQYKVRTDNILELKKELQRRRRSGSIFNRIHR